MLQDLRIAWRGLVREWPSTAVLLATLSVGIGATTAIVSVVHAVLLRPLPFEAPENLVRVLSRNSFPDMRDWIEQNRTFESFGGYNLWLVDFLGAEVPERVQGAIVTGELLPLLGVAPALGRVRGPAVDRPGGARVVLFAHDFWERRFEGDRAIVGRTISLNGEPFTVQGVMPAGFRLPGAEADLLLPYHVVSPESAEARGVHSLIAIGRLKGGVALDAAQADMDAIARRLEELYPDENTGRRFRLEPWKSQLASGSQRALLLLLGAVGLVLLIAIANVAGLLLARTARRETEIALRSAIGATRGRIVRQLLVESILLALGGGLLGIGLARILLPLLVGLAPSDIPRLHEVGLHPPVLLASVLVSMATGVLFGIAPILQANRLKLTGALKQGPRSDPGRNPLRGALIVSEVATAVVLLIGAGLLTQSLYRLMRVDPGFRAENLVTMDFLLPVPEYREIPKRIAFFDEVLSRLRGLPGVEGVAATTDLPFGTGSVPHNLAVEGRAYAEGSEPEIYYRGISPDYFRVMGISLLEGRAFTDSDREGSLPVVIVNQAFAGSEFPGESPLGRRLRWARRDEVRWLTIVGVASDVKPSALDASELEAVYLPFHQEQDWWRTWMSVTLRSAASADALSRPIRTAVAEIEPSIPVANLRPMSDLVFASTETRRFHLVLLSGFAATALFLAAIGLYGLLAYLVAERRRELGIRLAMGAGRASILGLVLGRGLKLALAGLGLGSLAALALRRLVSGFLFEVSPTDPTTFLAIAVLLLGVSALASLLPAHRATRLDPLTSIRYE